MGEQRVIGGRYPLKDAGNKVTGEALYTPDMMLPGMLHAKLLRSPYPHARIIQVDTSEAEKLAGVRAVLSKNNAPRMKVPVVFDSPRDRVLFDDKVRFAGEEVAAVAAVTEAVAKRALELIEVEYEALPTVFYPEEALQEDAALVHDGAPGNVVSMVEMGAGDVEAGFAAADLLFEETYRTSAQRHCCLETHCAIARFDANDKLTIWTPTQVPFQLQSALAEYLKMPMSKVRIVNFFIGGGFGSKIDMLVEHICALLAGLTARPVKLVLTREEEFDATVSRHAFVMNVKAGVRKDTRLTAIKAEVLSNEGAYLYKAGPLEQAGRAFSRTYRCPNTEFVGTRVYTNLMSAGAFRGYGNAQAHFALETMMDRIAVTLGMDPVEFRILNYRQSGDVGFAGEAIGISGVVECLKRGKEEFGWETKRGREFPGGIKRGVGLACYTHETGTWGVMPDYSAASIRINEDGTAHLSVGVADLGTGSRTTLAQIAAEELGLELSAIEVTGGDTDSSSFDRGAYASKTLFTGGNAARLAALAAKTKILTCAAERLNLVQEDLEIRDGQLYRKDGSDAGLSYRDLVRELSKSKGGNVAILGEASFANASAPSAFGAQFVEVEVDTETGRVTLVNVVTAQDSGKIINPMVVEGQIEGAVQQGLGWALMENPSLDARTGRLRNPDFANYMMPTALDMPEVKIELIETIEPSGPFGAKGMSEAPFVGMAPAIANAIYDAIKIRFNDLPITAESVFMALQERKGRH